MTTLQIGVSDDLKARLQEQAAAEGFGSVEEYAKALLAASSEEGFVDAQTEKLLLERLDDSRAVEFGAKFREQFKSDVHQRRRNRGTHL